CRRPLGDCRRPRPHAAGAGHEHRRSDGYRADRLHHHSAARRLCTRRPVPQPGRARRRSSTMTLATSVDPITLEVMRNALYSIADEMTAGLVRASYSTNIKDRRDCSCALYTTRGEVIAMSEWGGTPLHLGTMHSALGTALEAFPP